MKLNKYFTARKSMAALGLAVSVGLVACAEKVSPEEIVKQRVTQRWAIKTQNSVEGLYEFISPAQKQIVDKQSYEGRIGSVIKYLSADVQSVTCQSVDSDAIEVCDVKVYVKFLSPGLNNAEGGTLLKETWVKQNDEWWLSES